MKRRLTLVLSNLIALSLWSQTFTNPLLPSGPDPWVLQDQGTYYYMNSTGSNLTVWKTKSIADLKTAERKVVWRAPPTGPFSKEIWAPEIHRFAGKWYIYFAADNGKNRNHRLWVIETDAADPLEGTWSKPLPLGTADNHWAIDASVFENHGHLYMIWSGWEGDSDGEQDLYIAHLSGPTAVASPRVRLSRPEKGWEKVGDLPGHSPPHVNVNEGPEMLRHGDKLFLIYSASGCWTDNYELGELTASVDSDLLNPDSWVKNKHPVFKGSSSAHAFGPGHNGFFQSPDGKQDWIIYHANPGPHQGCNNQRAPRAQPFTWKKDGTPNFGKPVPIDKPLLRP